MTEYTSAELLACVRNGDDQACRALFDRFVERLVELTRQRISPKLARRLDAEDVVQSAYRSFFVHAREGRYVVERSGDLWRLLAAIALKKLYGQVEWHTAQRRSIANEEAVPGDLSSLQTEYATPAVEPTQVECLEIVEQLQLVMQDLHPDERIALEMRLTGQTTEEIANGLGRSQRTVRRFLEHIRHKLEQRFQN